MTVRSHTFTQSTTMVTEECCQCHVLFALTEEMQRDLRQSKRMFYCPSGHQQHYIDKTDAEKLAEAERRIASLREEIRITRVDVSAQRTRAEQAEAKVKRVEKGVCPHCRRHFVNVERHVQNKHSS